MDDDRGLVRRVTDDRRFGFGGYQCQTVVELIAIEVRSLSWMESLAAEADAYMKTVEKWRAKVEEASIADDAAKCLATMGEARRLLAAGRQEAAIHEIIELYDATLSLHDDNLSLEMAMAVKRQLLLRNPPVEWETTDLTDQQHRSVDYRGKVVVMDFWYRGCEHCVKAMPKIKSLAKKYEAQPVSFLGMSVDQEVENARFVVNKLRLDCPVLRAREIVEQYGLRGYPTFLVLDQSGRVALHAFGNSENLEQAIGSVVDELLAHPRK